jgi:hypothetical protein
VPRVISAALSAQFAQTVTSVGYLVHIGFSSPVYWSNIGTVQYPSGGQTWTDKSFSIDGLAFDIDREMEATLTIDNLDGAAASLFLAGDRLYDTIVTVYQFDRDALASGDAPKIARMAINSADISLKSVNVRLSEQSAQAAYSPRRRINPTDGFYYATPPGATFSWGGSTIILEDSEGG